MTHPAFALVRLKLRDLIRERDLALTVRVRVIDRLAAATDDEASVWAANALLGTAAEGIFTGAEDLLKALLKQLDGYAPGGGSSSHAELLAQAVLDRDGRDGRPPVLSSKTFALLDKLRAFRHFERNNYRFRFDQAQTQQAFERAIEAVPMVVLDIERAMARVETEDQSDG